MQIDPSKAPIRSTLHPSTGESLADHTPKSAAVEVLLFMSKIMLALGKWVRVMTEASPKLNRVAE